MLPELKSVPIFAGLNEAALDLLLTRREEGSFTAGTLILNEGDPGNRFYLILMGSVHVVKNLNQPHQSALATLERLNFFGEMCILETLPRSASVIAASDTKVLSLPSIAFYHLYQKMPDQYSILVLNIARDLSRRLRHLDEEFAARH